MILQAQETTRNNLKQNASDIFSAAVSAVDPELCVEKHLKLDSGLLRVGDSSYDLDIINNIYLVGFGKASAAMARPVENLLGDRITNGLIITKYGHGLSLNHCKVFEAGHPLPDENGRVATDALLNLVGSAREDDLVLCLISGGGSALTPAPVDGIDLADKQMITELLLSCGASIHEINTIRKHLSKIKGGQLCRQANGSTMVSLILSDVIGDDLDIIASGATAPDRGTYLDCMNILTRYHLLEKAPKLVVTHLQAGCNGQVPETVKLESGIFRRVSNHIVGSISEALAAAESRAKSLNFNTLILSSTVQGEASEVAKVLSSIAREVRQTDRPIDVPACLLCGGETTVTLYGSGKGGRNMELALAAAIELDGLPETLLLSAGTDGTDGPTDAAGAFVDGNTLTRAAAKSISPHHHLAENDSYPFFKVLDDLLITGPTRTNVMDLQVMLIDKQP